MRQACKKIHIWSLSWSFNRYAKCLVIRRCAYAFELDISWQSKVDQPGKWLNERRNLELSPCVLAKGKPEYKARWKWDHARTSPNDERREYFINERSVLKGRHLRGNAAIMGLFKHRSFNGKNEEEASQLFRGNQGWPHTPADINACIWREYPA